MFIHQSLHVVLQEAKNGGAGPTDLPTHRAITILWNVWDLQQFTLYLSQLWILYLNGDLLLSLTLGSEIIKLFYAQLSWAWNLSCW